MADAAQLDALSERARWLLEQPELLDKSVKSFAPGFIGFAGVRAGDRILLASSSHDDPDVTAALTHAFRERGASVDLITLDAGPDRELTEDDEIRAAIRREPFAGNPRHEQRRFTDIAWLTELATSREYDLFVQGRAYPTDAPCRWEGHPWAQAEQFLSEATAFPRDLHVLINETSWAPVWNDGKGARVRFTDPEGTDLEYTLLPEFWDDAPAFGATPLWNHLMYVPIPPYSERVDARGVAAGTIAHFSKPFPQIRVHLKDGLVQRVEGGGAYGEGWRELLKETRKLQYPQYPRPGLFWFMEAALGTNPKVARPSEPTMISSGGTDWERWRAGALHLGFGTAGPGRDEAWAGERGYPYGHIHVHLQFPTIELTTVDGRTIRTVEDGRLTALDDPAVRKLAATYGDPDEVLAAVWTPPLPGVSVDGDIEDYLREPARWFGGEEGR